MGDRYRTADGWAVEVVELSATPDRNDGERLKVTYYGSFVAVVRTVAELEQWFTLSDLEPETLISCPERAGWSDPPPPGSGKRSRGRSRAGPGSGDRLTAERGRSRECNGRDDRIRLPTAEHALGGGPGGPLVALPSARGVRTQHRRSGGSGLGAAIIWRR